LKETIYILTPYPKGEAPSQRFRFEQYLDILEQEGFEIESYSFLSQKAWDKIYNPGKYFTKFLFVMQGLLKRWSLIIKLKKADYVFVHREMAPVGPPVFEWISAKILGIKYIYDFDDAIWLTNYSKPNASFQFLKFRWKIKYCIKWAHKVVAGNEYLAENARKFNDNVQVIPTTIDFEKVHNQHSDQTIRPIVVGWTGTFSTLYYLEEVIPVLKGLETKYEFEFHVICNTEPAFQLNSLKYIPWNKTTEISDLSRIQIGLMPLTDYEWSLGKCGFKALQYMALEIPTLLSPVGVNQSIVTHEETGLFCQTREDWKNNLAELLADEEMRIKMGKEGKLKVEKGYSKQAWKTSYSKLFIR
jgi:glycosyltransferase involved in cell wall biosynthesis